MPQRLHGTDPPLAHNLNIHAHRYVLYKERNVLLTEEYACKRNRVTMPSPHRKTMVRLTPTLYA